MKSYLTILKYTLVTALLTLLSSAPALAGSLPSHTQLQSALREVVAEDNGGFGFNMWATVVDRDGVVQAVVFSGEDRGQQWPGSRAISAQKANTANAFSLPENALSTANLFWAVQPGNSLYGLQASNPVNPEIIYRGPSRKIGTKNDPMVDEKVGGVNVFGGGLPLYDSDHNLVGALGVSGDRSCADHNIAWKLRHNLDLDEIPGGVSPTGDDNIVYDISNNGSASGWGHPECTSGTSEVAQSLPNTHPVGSAEVGDR